MADTALISKLQAQIAQKQQQYNAEMAKDGRDRNVNPATIAAQIRSLQKKLKAAKSALTGTKTSTKAPLESIRPIFSSTEAPANLESIRPIFSSTEAPANLESTGLTNLVGKNPPGAFASAFRPIANFSTTDNTNTTSTKAPLESIRPIINTTSTAAPLESTGLTNLVGKNPLGAFASAFRTTAPTSTTGTTGGSTLPAGYKLHTNRIGKTNTYNYRVSGPNGFNSAGHPTKEAAIQAAIAHASPAPTVPETPARPPEEITQGVVDTQTQIQSDPSAATRQYSDEVMSLTAQLDALNMEYGETPTEEQKQAIIEKEKALANAQRNLGMAKQYMQQAQTTSAAGLMSSAMSDPTSIITKATQGTIDTTGTEIAVGTGQVTGAVPSATATPATAVEAAGPTPITAATYDATTVGKAAVADAATGVVSDEAQIEAQQGAISEGALAEGQVFDEEYIRQVEAGIRKVSSQELVDYARANNIPVAEAAQMFEPYLDVEAATFVGETPQAEAQDIYSLTPTQIAQQTATKVQDAAKASEIPSAEAAVTGYQSTVSAAQGRVGANELVNAKDIVGAEKAVTAVAATMEALNEDAIAVAATGSFSQAALAKAEQGTVPPQATIQGQMASLMEQFNNGTPAWAAGAMRAANAAMAARGLGGSSMAGAAIVQATMEAALPIAQNDAQAFFTMGMQNLNNRQQVALANAAAQQNIELANLNNRQQAALQNSTNSFALQSQNLSNQQSVVLANAQMKAALQSKVIDVKTQAALTNAARYAEVANINLNNRQQANLQRSAENLQVELTNLSNVQQTALANLQVRSAIIGQELSNEQQMAVLQSTQDFERANFDASAKQQAFLQDAQARAALEGRAMDIRQQTQLFNVSAILEERQLELSNEQQTRLFNSTNKLSIDMAELSNRQQTALANAQIEATLRGQELSNKQQSAVLNAERFAEANNLTFTTEQQTKLYNSQLMQTVGMANLNNKQAAALQNAATLAGMDMANLNNRQQAAVLNAQAFLQMDMANLTNEQQSAMFNAQAQQQVLLSDQAASNAALQFNAASQNQTDQFMASLSSQVSQFNTAQKNAMSQFNADEANAISQFNASLKNQREQFNATNSLVIAQANAQWRQAVSTTEFAAQHEANMAAAQAANTLTSEALDQLYQRERDLMAFSFTASESSMERMMNIILADKELEAVREQIKAEKQAANSAAWGAIAAEAVSFLFG